MVTSNMDIVQWIKDRLDENRAINAAVEDLRKCESIPALDLLVASFPAEIRDYPSVKMEIITNRKRIEREHAELKDPLAVFIEGALTNWIKYVETLGPTTPEESKQKLSEISAKVMEVFGASAAIDIGLGMLPNGAGEASTGNSKELLKWLGFGAVIAAIAHDPVKIGVLRPYQDNLEATFRNRRPEYVGILNAYRQRSLSTTVVTDTSLITDDLMDTIETENNANMDFYGAQWGYPQKWITIEKDAATKAMTFGNLMAMARLGYYDRGMSIFSLWTYGIDRRLMKSALQSIETARDVGMWKGFRSMVEPSYVQGLIEESDLTEYWTKILVPPDVQSWAILRLRNSRAKYAAKELKLENAASKDLTKADWTKAYQDDIISLDEYKTKLTALGYDAAEVDVLVKLADLKKVGPTSTACKHLPLSDYELAHRNGILTLDQVLQRMQGEYCQADIDLEKQLLEINDLTSEAPAKERDLTVSQLSEAYVDGLIDLSGLTTSLTALGYDAAESAILISFAEQRKTAAAARVQKAGTAGSVTKERDLTLSQLTAAYVDNIIDEAAYTTDLGTLGYDASETTILLKLAQIKKKLPSVVGLKRLPLSDYEKAWKYSQLTADQVLDRMRGEYREEDIQLERLLLTIGKP
jgi:hypothetical protein